MAYRRGHVAKGRQMQISGKRLAWLKEEMAKVLAAMQQVQK